MEAIILIEFCVTFLLMIVLDGVRTETMVECLDNIAINGGDINGKFKPLENGSLGPSGSGPSGRGRIYYKGLLLPSNEEVAVKFIHMSTGMPQKEYRMYTYLNAIDRPNVTGYGIPCIYYYGQWNNHAKMLAMTSFDHASRVINQVAEIDQMQLLVIFLEFVRIIKYIHSRGIIHHGIKLENMLMQNGQSYIFNFEQSIDMSINTRARNMMDAKGDFKSFLWAVYSLNSTRIRRWFGFSDQDASRVRNVHVFLDILSEVASRNRGTIVFGVKRVIYQFEEYAANNQLLWKADANGNSIPFYDHLYQIINEELDMYGASTSSDLTLSYIPDPFGTDVWLRSQVEPNYFERN